MVERKSKLIVREFGYVLEDIPHLSDYISSLPEYRNPLQLSPAYSVVRQLFVDPDDSVTQKILVDENAARGTHFRRAGPREKVCFMPEEVNACIVTPGGLCPGLNTLIRELVHGLYQMYGVTKVTGIHGGYKGFSGLDNVCLTPEVVHDIHKVGGTVLGSSREEQDTMTIVDCIQEKGFNQVYIIGGHATLQRAASVYEEIEKRQLKVSVVGIPRCIDNDIKIIDKSFGFDTVVEEAQRAIKAAHVEAESVENGVGVVKLMGRHSGFIALYSSLASRDVDCCLIPESPFFLEGKSGLLEFLERRLRENGHLVIVLSEGTGRDLILESMKAILQEDSSAKLPDVGLWLSEKIKKYFKRRKIDLNLKYIDPTYMIRAVRSNASDNVYCTLLAHSALHGAMAGYTGFCVGPVNGKHAYIPIHLLLESTNQVCTTDRMWARLLSSTEQPSFMD